MTSSVQHDEVIQILLKLRELLVRSLNIFTYMIAMLRLGVLDLFAPEMEHVHHVWRHHFAWLVAYQIVLCFQQRALLPAYERFSASRY